MQNGSLNRPGRKKMNFQNPRWRTAAILKTVKSSYLSNRLTDFDEIWHGDANWPRAGDNSHRPPDKTKQCRVWRGGMNYLLSNFIHHQAFTNQLIKSGPCSKPLLDPLRVGNKLNVIDTLSQTPPR